MVGIIPIVCLLRGSLNLCDRRGVVAGGEDVSVVVVSDAGRFDRIENADHLTWIPDSLPDKSAEYVGVDRAARLDTGSL